MVASPKTGDLELGRRIAARREELGLTRKQLADAMDVSYPYVAQIETGYRSPSVRHQMTLARHLGMSLDELFGTEDAVADEPAERRPARRRTTLDDAIAEAAAQISALPPSVRLDALAQLQRKIMEGVIEDQARG